MRLLELSPQFVRREIRDEWWTRVLGDPLTWKRGDPVEQVFGPREYHVPVATIAEADGVMFLCPKCVKPNGGGHRVLCWRPHVPAEVLPKPGRWEFLGTGLDDLSLRAGSSSVQLIGGCEAHFHIESGEIRMC